MTSIDPLAFDDSKGDGDSVLRYLENHEVEGELKCTCVFKDDHVIALESLIKENHGTIHLTALRLPNNGLTEDSSDALAGILRSQNETIRTLDLTENPLKASGLNLLIDPLIHDHPPSKLSCLNLTSTMLGSQGATALARVLKHNHSLKTLILANNNLGSKGIKTIAPALEQNPHLEVLDVSCNKINSKGGNVLAKAIETNPKSKIKTLDISSNKIGDVGVQAFAQLLLFDTQMEDLFAQSIHIGIEGAIHMAKVLEYNYTLRRLKLGGNQISPLGTRFLMEGLAKNTSTALEILDLSWNAIGPEGAKQVAEVLKENSKLTSVNLEGNQIGNIGCESLAKALKYNFSLKELILTNNHIETQGAFSLAMALGNPSCCLENVKWEENLISEEGVAVLDSIKQLKRNREEWLEQVLRKLAKGTLFSINLQQKVIGDLEVIFLTNVLAEHSPIVRTFWVNGETLSSFSLIPLVQRALPPPSNIQRFYLKQSTIGDDVAIALGQALRQNITLEVCSLTDCSISAQGASEIAEGLKYNSSLRRLNLDRNLIQDDGFMKLLGTLPHPTLTALSVCDNQITDKSMSVTNIKHLTELCLNGNSITDLGTLKLCESLMQGSQLMRLSLRDNKLSTRGGNALKSFLPENAICEFDYEDMF